MRQIGNPQSNSYARGKQWAWSRVSRESGISVVGVSKHGAVPMRSTALLIVFLVAGPASAQVPELPPCDPGMQGAPEHGIPNRPAASMARCAAFRASAEVRPAAAAATLLDHAASWRDYFAQEAERYRGDFRRFTDMGWAGRVAEIAIWRAVFFLGAAGPCAPPFDPMAMVFAANAGSAFTVPGELTLPREVIPAAISSIRQAATQLRTLAADIRARCRG